MTENKNETAIEIKFEAESTHSIEMQRSGWQTILDNFKNYVEALSDAFEKALKKHSSLKTTNT